MLILDDVRVDVGSREAVEVATSVERVNIDHHILVPVYSCPSVCEEFLCPTAKLMAGTVVRGDFVYGVAVTDPEKMAPPEIWVDGRKGPSTSGNFADV